MKPEPRDVEELRAWATALAESPGCGVAKCTYCGCQLARQLLAALDVVSVAENLVGDFPDSGRPMTKRLLETAVKRWTEGLDPLPLGPQTPST